MQRKRDPFGGVKLMAKAVFIKPYYEDFKPCLGILVNVGKERDLLFYSDNIPRSYHKKIHNPVSVLKRCTEITVVYGFSDTDEYIHRQNLEVGWIDISTLRKRTVEISKKFEDDLIEAFMDKRNADRGIYS